MKFFRNIKDFILSYEYPKEKHFVISFPKTGRTWLMHMLDDIQKTSNKNLFIEYTHDMSEIIIENGYRQDPTILFRLDDRFRYRRSKVIFLVRDPRDVIVSHFHQVTKRSQDPFVFSSISEFVQHEIYGFKRIIFFYNMWYKQKNIPKDFLLVKYEDLLQDGVNELNKIIRYLEVDVSLDVVRESYYKFTADKMRKNEMKVKLQKSNNFVLDRNELKVRNAKIGGYLNELSNQDIDFCNLCMKNLNSFFNYTI